LGEEDEKKNKREGRVSGGKVQEGKKMWKDLN